MIDRLRASNFWTVASVLPRADAPLALTWWSLLILRGVLPAVFAIVMGVLVGAIQHGTDPIRPLVVFGIVFLLLQILPPIHRAAGANLGSRTAAWLYDRLTEACVRPSGMGHLENPGLSADLSMARDFDLGITGPPMSISMDFIASGLIEMVGGIASALVLAAYSWWAPVLLAGAWIATHYLLRESAIWRDRNTEEVRQAQRHADYAYRLAVDPPAPKSYVCSVWLIGSSNVFGRGGGSSMNSAGKRLACVNGRSSGAFCSSWQRMSQRSGRWAPLLLTGISRSHAWSRSQAPPSPPA